MTIQIQRARYFWMTIERDCVDYMRKCKKYQVHEYKINVPPVPLFNMVSNWHLQYEGKMSLSPLIQK